MLYDPFADLSDTETHFENVAGGGPADVGVGGAAGDSVLRGPVAGDVVMDLESSGDDADYKMEE